MKLTFLGAAHEVTGSCFYLEACGRRILIDCGMEQGPDLYENQQLPISPADLDCVLLTHAHIDHSGKLPLLAAQGFRGQIYATDATCDLCDIMLRDSAHIQEFEAEWRNRKAKRAGKEEYIPLYTMADAVKAVELFVPCDYGVEKPLYDGVKIRFTDVGHLLGSASIEVWLKEDGIEKKIVFSGDIGNKAQPLLKDPQYIREADYAVMESTYGDRSHGPAPDYIGELAGIIQETFDNGGNVVIPSFAVGRTQEMLYFLRKIKADGLIKGYDGFPVYVDSPLAIEATHIFTENRMDCYDAEAMELVSRGVNPISFPGLKVSVTSDDSRAINFDKAPKVILSASGMCDAGRIKHHLKHNLWREECTVLFVGYQAVGTLGRAIVDGAASVKLFGEEVEVKARIRRLSGISGHADDKGLLEWAAAFEKKPQKIFVVHGEDKVCETFAARLRNELQVDAEAPYSGDSWELAQGFCVCRGSRKKIEKHYEEGKTPVSAVFARLLAAGKRLMAVIGHNEGGSNKDLAKFADQIDALCEKWDR
ncbi:MAG: MBL fold metallo-hydrolase [Oscillospiraceae bacterium]|nr:MBL fold metallo-hydrolase [Oscillospiraceae bacterium]